MVEMGFFIAGIAILAGGAFWLKGRFYRFLLRHKGEGRMLLDPSSLGLVNKLISLVIAIVSAIGLLHFMGINILPLVTVGGIGAGLMAFSGKEMLANFFSGLMLHLSRPFSVGDQVELPGKQVIGYIEEIGWCSTAIRDRQKKIVYLPNSIFSSEVLVNVSRASGRKFQEVLRLRRSFVLEEKIDEMRRFLSLYPRLDQVEPIYVFVKSLSQLFVEIEVQAYTGVCDEEEFVEIKHELLLALYQIGEVALNR